MEGKRYKTALVVSRHILDPEYSKCKLLNIRFGNSRDEFGEVWSHLNRLFDNVVDYDFSNNLVKKGFKATNAEILELVKTKAPEFLIIALAFDEHMIDINMLQKVREAGTRTVGFFVDDLTAMDAVSKMFIPALDFIVTLDSEESVERYRAYGAKAIFTPSGFSSKRFFKRNLKIQYDVTFIGSNILGRGPFIDELKSKGINVKTFGSGWESGYISNEEMNSIFEQSRINLNFTKTINGKTHFKWRTFEVPATGGFMLTENIPGLEKYFDIGSEIDVFSDADSCAERIIYYLNNEEKRKEMAEKAWKRATQEYTWAKRFEYVFDCIESGDYHNDAKEIPITEEDWARRSGRKTLYAMALYAELGKTKAYKEIVAEARRLPSMSKREKYILTIMGTVPYFLGRKIISKGISIYLNQNSQK